MKQLIYILIIIIFFSCNTEKTIKSKEDIVREYIDFVNKGDKNNIDLITSSDFKLYNDTAIIIKNRFLKKIIKPIANGKVEIIKIETTDTVVKTTERITDDFVSYFKTDTIERIREYYLNDSNLITSIHNIQIVTPIDYLGIQKKFDFWAKQEYPIFYKKIGKRLKNNKNISDERKYLVSKLRENGFEVLNNIELKKINVKNKRIKKDYITTTSFRKFANGKTKNEIKNRFGNPCSTQYMTGLGKIWYYGYADCMNNKSRTIIFDKESGKEVSQAQIIFSDLNGLVKMVNFF